MSDAIKSLRRNFPSVQFRPIPVDLGKKPEVYMSAIIEATNDIPVSVVVNNAGYLMMGYFHNRSIEAQVANIECNTIAAVRITHHFYNRMIAEKMKGCITFTSSAAFFLVRFLPFCCSRRRGNTSQLNSSLTFSLLPSVTPACVRTCRKWTAKSICNHVWGNKVLFE